MTYFTTKTRDPYLTINYIKKNTNHTRQTITLFICASHDPEY
jgi:hypothetical protein